MFRIALSAISLIAFAPLASSVVAQTFTDRSDLLDAQDERNHSAWGASIADVDGNGLPDIYEPGILYLQQPDGSFRSSLSDMGVKVRTDQNGNVLWGRGIFGSIMADVNDDGISEMVVMDLTDDSSHFYMGRHGLLLDETGPEAGVLFKGKGQGSTFADFNGDGFLDLFFGEERGHNQLFLGDGTGLFNEFTTQAGVDSDVQTYGVAAADYDGDGDLDIFIGACAVADPSKSVNLLFRNNGDGTFEEVGAEAGINDNLAAWGVNWLDFDRDGDMDVYVANMIVPGDSRSGDNMLYRNNGDGTFTDVAEAAGVHGPNHQLSFGSSATDLNNDGWIDLYVANNIAPPNIYINNGDGTFTDRFVESGLSDVFQNFSVSVADLNADGWLDVFTGADNIPYSRIFMNDGGTNGWLKVSLVQPAPNIKAIGAQLSLWIDGALQRRDITSGDGFTSQNMAHMAHFGMGESAMADSVVVTWPDGTKESWTSLSANQHVWLEKGGSTNRPPSPFLTGEIVTRSFGKQTTGRATWDLSTDPEGQLLTYVVAVRSPDGQIAYESGPLPDGTDFLEFDIDGPEQDGNYAFAVTASDGAHIVRSLDVGTVLTSGTSTEEGQVPDSATLLDVWPQPAGESLSVSWTSSSSGPTFWEIVDLTGRRVGQGAFDANEQNVSAVLDIASLRAGLYLIRVTSESKTASRPFIKGR